MLKKKKKLMNACVIAGGVLCSLALMSHAYADNCDNFDRNKSWSSNMEKLNAAYEKEDWNSALRYSRELEQICDQSPILNYTIAHIHKNLGDNEKYLFYLRKIIYNEGNSNLERTILYEIGILSRPYA